MGLFDNIFGVECSLCHKLFSTDQDCIDKFRDLFKRFDVPHSAYDSYTHLCGGCWEKIHTVSCNLCQGSFSILEDHSNKLERNLKQHGVVIDRVSAARRVCPKYFSEYEHSGCSRCQKVFRRIQDQLPKFRMNYLFEKWLSPYHEDFSRSLNWSSLCPECYGTCLKSCENVENRLARWVEGTRYEYVKDYRALERFDRVEYRTEDCDEPAQVEEKLKLYAVQRPGNAYVKSFIGAKDKIDEEIHYGPKGNPYTISKKRWWFTGYATPVYVKPKAGGSPLGPIIHLFTFFDANTRHLLRTDDDSVFKVYDGMLAMPYFQEVPGGSKADDFILLKVKSENAHVISNDKYEDYATSHSWISREARLIKGAVVSGRVAIPDLGFDVRILPEEREAFQSLKEAFAGQHKH